MKKPPRKQHIQPRAYLARFEDEEGHLWAYEAGKEPRRSRAKREATTRDYFEVKIPGEETHYSMEDRLARLESLAEPAIRNLIKGEQLNAQELHAWGLYASSIFIRSRKVRDHLTLSVMNAVRKDFTADERLRDEQLKWFQRTGKLLRFEDMKRISVEITEKFDDPAFRHNQALNHNTHSVASKLADKEWHVARPAPGRFFLTSDAPAFSYVLRDSLLYPGYGWGLADAFVALPLTPRRMFVAAPTGHPVPSEYDEVSTETLNRAIAAFADRFVYSDRKDECVTNLANELIGQVRFGVDAYVLANPSAA